MHLGNDIDINGPVLALLGVLITVIVNYVIQKNRKTTDLQLVDKKILSEEQLKFRDSIIFELNNCRTTVLKLQKDNQELQQKVLDEKQDKLKLTQEIIELRYKIIQLKQQVEEVMKRVEDKELNDSKAKTENS